VPETCKRSSGMRRLRLADLPPMRHSPRTGGRAGNRVGERFFAILAVLFLASCGSGKPQQPSTGAAYAGPATLILRRDLASKAPTVGSVRHGEKLEVIETRRRFVKVRTPEGVEGWTDSNLLLTPQQMGDLQRLAERAAKFPSQGTATVYEPLNMHTEPARQSASFFQISEAAPVEVIAHRVAPRVAQSTALRPAPVVRRAARRTKGKDSRQANSLLPPPPSPRPPANWEVISRPRAADLPGYAAKPVAPAASAVDDWDLVRTRDGKAGWVLSRMLTMSIPDDVAQYAEGHRITAYASLGEVQDKNLNQVKHNWLWTTSSGGAQPYEFDSFRVFVWSTSRHRYETAYIERNVKGFYPVDAESIPGEDGKGFSLVLEEKDGKRYKKTYAFTGYHVRMISKVPYEAPPELPEVRAASGFAPEPEPAPAESSWAQRFREWRPRWLARPKGN